MDFSAFLGSPMAKDKEKIKLKPVDEETPSKVRLVRLHRDTVEEFDEVPVMRGGSKSVPEARLELTGQDRLKTRSNEPDVGELIERDATHLEQQWEAPTGRKFPWGWIALLGCIFGAGIIWSLAKVTRSKEQQETIVHDTEGFLDKEQREIREAEMTIEKLESSARDYFKTTSIKERLKLVRQPERVAPLMDRYYSQYPLKAEVVSEILSLDPLTIDGMASFWLVSCKIEGSGDQQIIVEVKADGATKIDWETLVCYQPISWEKFSLDRPKEYKGDFRVYVEQDNFYSHEFADSEKYMSYRLSVITGDQILYGYAERDSEAYAALANEFKAGEGVTPMMLRLEIPSDPQSKNGVIIRKLISPRWIFLKNPETEGS